MESILHLSASQAAEAMAVWEECPDAREFACRVFASMVNAMMDSQAQDMCGAGRGERSADRSNSRNGYRERGLKTTVGDVVLRVPKLRHGTYTPDGIVARYSRVEASLVAVVREMYTCGVSTRKVERVAEKLGVSSLSSSEVSRLCAGLDEEVEAFRSRDLSGTPCCYVWLDATYMRCREGSRVVSDAVVTAIGLGADGRKHFLGCDVVDTESEQSWTEFLRGLVGRGLSGVRLVVSDDHRGLVAAAARVFQGCSWQRCVAHLQRNLASAAVGRPEGHRRCVAELVRAATTQGDPDLCHAVWAESQEWVSRVSRKAGELFAAAEDSALAFAEFPAAHWPKIRTNNVQERENREIKRRYRAVQSFPSRESMTRLVCATLIEDEGRWATQRVFSEASAALGFEGPREAAPLDAERSEALVRRAREIVREVVDRHGLSL